jgi:hypothetical protein
MAWGDRRSTRVYFGRVIDAQMVGTGGAWRRECQLVDVSVSGAKLIVSGSIEGLNLKEFFLLLTPTGVTFRRCELARVNGNEIGVRFVKKSEVRKPARRRASVSLVSV